MDLKTKNRDASTVEPAGKTSLFERLGGADAIGATVEQFYERVLKDPKLKPFFANTNLKWLKERQKRFFTQALGGPPVYNGRPMREAHAHLAIEQLHFNLVAGHLVNTLAALGVPKGLIDETVVLVAPLAAEIVNTDNSQSRDAHTRTN